MAKLKDPRTVKIFFSSPFGGMEEEREELTRRYWPQIAHLCNAHGLQFAAVDMRWGITAESSDKAQVINICLREIDRSDMFIGFFGQRYGWHGADDASLQKNFDNAVSRYPWLEEVRDKSVTELEFLHGFLNNPGNIPAAIFFRDKVFDDRMLEEGEKTGDKKQVFKYSAESELSTRLMDDLKRRVWENKNESLGVYMDYKTPAEAASIMYTTIMDYLRTTLLVDLASQRRTAREEVLSQHDAFLASRSNVFVQGEAYLSVLDRQRDTEARKHVVVIGDTGVGKSALLCNWISKLKQDRNLAVVYHFTGFADNSTDIDSLLSRIAGEFEHILNALLGVDQTSGEPSETIATKQEVEKDTTRSLVQRLLAAMSQLVGLGKLPVLIVDGVDKVTNTSQISKVLYWLPVNFPTGCLVVVSTLSSDVTNLQELETRNYLRLTVEPLSVDSKRDMSISVLGASGKELSPPQLDRIVNAEMTRIPLFLKIVMTELIAYGYFRLLDKKIDSLIHSESIEKLFQHVIVRLEEDYNVPEYTGNLVEKVMCTIQLSGHGCSETMLKELYSIPDQVWSPLYFALEPLIVRQSGMIKFGFKQLGDAVEKRYLEDIDKRNHYLETMVTYFNAELKELDKSVITHIDQLPYFPIANQLPDLLVTLGDRNRLAECIANFFVFSYLEKTNLYHLISLWRETELSGDVIAKQLLSTFDLRLVQIYTHLEERDQLKNSSPPGMLLVTFLSSVNTFLDTAGLPQGQSAMLERGVRIVSEGLKSEKAHADWLKTLSSLQYRLACALCENPHTAERGINLHQELLADTEKTMKEEVSNKYLLKRMGNYCHGIGVGYSTLGDYQKMIEYTERSIEYHMQTGKPNMSSIAGSWSNIGISYMNLEKYNTALEYLQKSIQALEDYYFHEVPPIIGEILTNKALCLRKMNRLDEAEAEYQRSLKVKIQAVGRDHKIVALTFMNLGTLETIRNNYGKAVEYTKQALQVYENLGQSWDNEAYIQVWENLLQYQTIGEQQFEEADKNFMKILDWRVKDGSMDRVIPSLYREMARYYLRAAMWEGAYKVCTALLGSAHAADVDGTAYILMDIALQNLPESKQQEMPEEFTLAHAVELFPGNVSLTKQYCCSTLIPNNNPAEVVRLVNILHDSGEMGVDNYHLSCDWCVMPTGEVNLDCQQGIVEEGLLKYPEDQNLHLNMAKILRKRNQAPQAYPHALKALGNIDPATNIPLTLFVAQTAILSGLCDDAERFCQTVEENCGENESAMNSVQQIKEWIVEVREYQQQQQQ